MPFFAPRLVVRAADRFFHGVERLEGRDGHSRACVVCVERFGGTGAAVQRFAFRDLFDVLGMRTVTFESDATGTPIGAHYMFASARDWTRFGSLYLDDGVVGGTRVLPEGWVTLSTTPTLGTAYGAGWWTRLDLDTPRKSPPPHRVPDDAFFAFGNLGQRLAVIPSEQLVIVRMARAHLPLGDMAGFEDLVVSVVAAVRAGAR